jgi:hypothetical protein
LSTDGGDRFAHSERYQIQERQAVRLVDEAQNAP